METHTWSILKGDSGAQKSLMTKKLFNEIDEPECQLKGYGANANIFNLGSNKVYLWRC